MSRVKEVRIVIKFIRASWGVQMSAREVTRAQVARERMSLVKAFACALFAALACQAEARAQNYPARAVTVIVPFAAGGPADITGRIVAEQLSRSLAQQFVVENVGGA
jgi:hypothetical protein